MSVREVNDRIAAVVDDIPALSEVRVRGEVTDFGGSSAAVYFTLTGGAEIDCMMWRNRYEAADVDLEDGIEIVAEGDIDYYVDGGRLSLKPWTLHVVGEGDRARAVERLRAELADRGWFADETKVEPPAFPDRVGIVTSEDGGARHDIVESIDDRDPGVETVLVDARVQGPDAPESIANGIQRLDRTDEVDVIVVGRGGGSETDLDAFDTEVVAEAIHTAAMPVVVAVGHAADGTIAGDTGDVNAITPTEAGSAVVADVERELERCDRLAEDLTAAYRTHRDTHLDTLERRLDGAYDGTVTERLDSMTRRLDAARSDHTAASIDDLHDGLRRARAVQAGDRLGDLDRRLNRVWTTHAADRIGELERRLDRAWTTHTANRIGELERRLETARDTVEREAEVEAEIDAEVEAETAALRKRARYYRVAAVVLAVILTVLAILVAL
ncbi:exodeoxyribonuclease VII large subunit [Halobacteriales archaeon SW_7_68_16]|nr:MAG: exodeoxyribonuclease VII large subunit [Halobacteriales archaeon SW_7_68_16]